MADFSKLNFLSRLDARGRVFAIFAGIAAVGLSVYGLSVFLSDDSGVGGSASVASAPDTPTTPGGNLSSEYQRAVEERNRAAAEAAKGGNSSSLPVIIKPGQVSSLNASMTTESSCTVLCGDDSANVGTMVDGWTKKGMPFEVAQKIKELASKNVSEAEFAQELDKLVKAGKLTPEQARELLEAYRKQHKNALVDESGQIIDAYVKGGKLPLAAATDLIALQKRGATPEEYAAALKKMVEQGLIDQATASELLNQYRAQRTKEIVARSIASINELRSENVISDDVQKTLVDLEQRMVAVDVYKSRLDGFVAARKMSPEVADKILKEFKQQKQDIGSVSDSSMKSMVSAAEEAAFNELRDLQAQKVITPETASIIGQMITNDVPADQFNAAIAQLVKDNKLPPEIAKLKIADYKLVKDYRGIALALKNMQDNNVSCSEQKMFFEKAVAAGQLSPADALTLSQECLAAQAAPSTASLAGVSGADVPKTEGYIKLQEALAKQEKEAKEAADQKALQAGQPIGGGGPNVPSDVFTEAERKAQEERQIAQQNRIKTIAGNMGAQAGQLLDSWKPPVMVHTERTESDKDKKAVEGGATTADGSTVPGKLPGGGTAPETPPIIKAGTILFAVLDTAVNSDYPDSPVLATIVDGKFKGAKLLGKLTTTKGVSGQMDRVALNFSIMNMDDWPKSKTSLVAFAIDPDTARSVLASDVNYHYMQRFGALMATSFLAGYGQAVTSSGGSTTQSAFGTSSTNAALSPSNKFAAALGQMASAVGQATKNYTERPPTVIIDSGVGIGILFMTDLT